MATDATITDQIQYMKENIESRKVNLACVDCGEWHTSVRIRELDEHPKCGNCRSGLLAMMRRFQDPEYCFVGGGREMSYLGKTKSSWFMAGRPLIWFLVMGVRLLRL